MVIQDCDIHWPMSGMFHMSMHRHKPTQLCRKLCQEKLPVKRLAIWTGACTELLSLVNRCHLSHTGEHIISIATSLILLNNYCHRHRMIGEKHGSILIVFYSIHQYYKSLDLTEEQITQRLNEVCRHRALKPPMDTPPNFWNMSIVSNLESSQWPWQCRYCLSGLWHWQLLYGIE